MNVRENAGRVLVIAGSDSGAGAGIQADIQAITALGAHPLPVLACLTVQDTRNVYGASAIEADLVRQQLDCLAQDTPFHAIKTGALGNAAIVETLLDFLADKPDIPLIVDPVIKAAGGGDLADQALAAVGEGDDGRGRATALRAGDHGGLATLHDSHDGVRGAQVDSDDLAHPEGLHARAGPARRDRLGPLVRWPSGCVKETRTRSGPLRV